MSEPKLTVIEGNLLIDPRDACGDFVSAEITDTRLMGVLGLHVFRKQNDVPFHQFFYLDTEEYGLDDYQSFLDMNSIDADKKKAELFGALGGNWTYIEEKEALFLIKHYSRINIRQKLPFPEGIDEYGPILSTDFSLTDDEKSALWGKICIKPRNDYELINYYIMRMVACDKESISRFTAPSSSIKGFNLDNPGTLLRNEIDKVDSEDEASSTHKYTCVSLLDLDKDYRLVESNISVLGNRVTSFSAKAPLSISPWEASLIMSISEYIIYTKVDTLPGAGSDRDWRDAVREAVTGTFSTVTESSYDFGSLYMIFRRNNDHVKKKLYRLDHDTSGVICVLDSGELVVAGTDPIQIQRILHSLESSLLSKGLLALEQGKYKFPEPVLVRFVDSDFETFEDFLAYLHSFAKE